MTKIKNAGTGCQEGQNHVCMTIHPALYWGIWKRYCSISLLLSVQVDLHLLKSFSGVTKLFYGTSLAEELLEMIGNFTDGNLWSVHNDNVPVKYKGHSSSLWTNVIIKRAQSTPAVVPKTAVLTIHKRIPQNIFLKANKNKLGPQVPSTNSLLPAARVEVTRLIHWPISGQGADLQSAILPGCTVPLQRPSYGLHGPVSLNWHFAVSEYVTCQACKKQLVLLPE